PLISTALRPPRATLFPYTTLFRSLPPPEPRWPGPGWERRRALRRRRWRRRPLPPSERCGGRSAGPPPPALRPSRDGRWAQQRCRSEEHTSELQSRENLVCRLLLEK